MERERERVVPRLSPADAASLATRLSLLFGCFWAKSRDSDLDSNFRSSEAKIVLILSRFSCFVCSLLSLWCLVSGIVSRSHTHTHTHPHSLTRFWSVDVEAGKRLAAYAAVDCHVNRDGMVIGVGSGSTVRYVVRAPGHPVPLSPSHPIFILGAEFCEARLASHYSRLAEAATLILRPLCANFATFAKSYKKKSSGICAPVVFTLILCRWSAYRRSRLGPSACRHRTSPSGSSRS